MENCGVFQYEGIRKDLLLGFVLGDVGEGLRKQGFALDSMLSGTGDNAVNWGS